jgi:hypothetical protein
MPLNNSRGDFIEFLLRLVNGFGPRVGEVRIIKALDLGNEDLPQDTRVQGFKSIKLGCALTITAFKIGCPVSVASAGDGRYGVPLSGSTKLSRHDGLNRRASFEIAHRCRCEGFRTSKCASERG